MSPRLVRILAAVRAVAPVALAVLAACSGRRELFEPRRVVYQHEAGTVHFAVLSVAPWEDVVDAVQPTFALDEEGALSAVVPNTQAMETTIQNVVQAELGVARDQGDALVDAPPSADGTVVLPGPSDDPHHAPPVVDEPIGLDPMLRYAAATALYQEVQLLNRSVRDAALRAGADAYVVRIQVSLMPSARHRPYDAYAHLSFFARDVDAEDDGTSSDVALRATGGAIRAPQIVPLLVTDGLEGSLQSRVADRVRQTALALRYLRPETGGAASFLDVDRELESVFGTDLNGLLTVARLSDNTLRVRLGARNQATTRFAMVPRTHDVTVLLLVPRGTSPSIDVVQRAVFVDAETGEALADRPPEEVDAVLAAVAADHALDLTAEEMGRLASFVRRNDPEAFERTLALLLPEDPVTTRLARSLWLDLALVTAGSQYASTRFDLPRSSLPPRQVALVADDGGACAARLAWPDGGDASGVAATLHVVRGGRRTPLAARSVERDGASGELVATFPSLAAWNLVPADGPLELELELREGDVARRYGALYSAGE